MKKKLSFLFFLLLLNVFVCTSLADTGKIGTVTVKDYICIENTNTQYEVTGYYNRSGNFEEYIYPGTKLYIGADETLSSLGAPMYDALTSTYTGDTSGVTLTFYYIMDESTYEQLKSKDATSGGGGGAGNPSGAYYNGYNIVITDETGKALSNYTASMDTKDWDGNYIPTPATTNAEGKACIDAMLNSMLGFGENRGYLPSGGDETDIYGNHIGVFTESIHTDPEHPLVIKDPSGKQIVKIAPKDYSNTSYIAPKQSEEIAIDNSFFDITTDDAYSVSITSPDLINDQYAWDYPMLTVTIQKKKDINSYGAAVIYNAYEYTGKAITPSVKIQGLTLGTDYEIVSYANNTNIGTASVTVKGIGDYSGTRTLTFDIYVNKGYEFTSGNLKYEVTTTRYEENNHVRVIGGTSKKITTVSIPATVTLGGLKFKVTSINKNAFKGYSKLKKATIGKNVSVIGVSAFYGCKKLSSVTIQTGLKGINGKAFMNCSSLKKITIKSTVLTRVYAKAFKGIHKKCVIKVPASKVKAYKTLLKGKGQASTVKITK